MNLNEFAIKLFPYKFTRPWFAWANTIFGELVLKTFNQNPGLLN
jgi:meiotically up-regulated gene 157 (Mug157) protein